MPFYETAYASVAKKLFGKKKKRAPDTTPDPYSLEWDPNTGMPIGMKGPPSARMAGRYQYRAEEIAAQRRAALQQGAMGTMGQGMNLFESFRPGGAAQLAQGQFAQKAGMMLGTAAMIEAPDMLFNYREDAARRAERAAKKARDAQIFGGIIQAAATIGGAVIGGPAGAVAGSAVGGVAGGAAGAQMGKMGGPGGAAMPYADRAGGAGMTDMEQPYAGREGVKSEGGAGAVEAPSLQGGPGGYPLSGDTAMGGPMEKGTGYGGEGAAPSPMGAPFGSTGDFSTTALAMSNPNDPATMLALMQLDIEDEYSATNDVFQAAVNRRLMHAYRGRTF